MTPSHPGRNAERNAAITIRIIAAFSIFATVTAAVTGISLLFPSPFWAPLWNLNPHAREAFQGFGRIAGVLLLFLGGLALATAVGLLRRRRWAWMLAVAVFAVNGAGDVVTLMVTGDILRAGSGIVIAGVFLFLLALPGVRRSFH